jgi:zinc transporter 2
VEGGQAQLLNGVGAHDHGGHGHGHGHGGEESINLKGAVIHVLGDLIQSLGVAAAGALIWWKQARTGWAFAFFDRARAEAHMALG